MLSRASLTKPRKQNRGRPAEKDCRQFLQWLRGRDCVCKGSRCEGRIEAAHVDFAGGKGVGTKVADRFAIPLCSYHHRYQHSIGWTKFQKAFAIDALSLALIFWNAWPGRVAWLAKQEKAQ